MPHATAPYQPPFWMADGLPAFIGRASAIAMFALIAAGTLLEQLVFRSLAGTALFAGLFALNALVAPYAVTWLRPDLFRGLTLAFLGVGLIAILCSVLHLYPEDRLLPLDDSFILRHAYFIPFWLPVLIGGVHLWTHGLGTIIRFSTRWALPVMAVIMVLDLATARFLADPTRDFVGYIFWMEKVSTAFLYTTVYLFHVAFARRVLPAVILTTLYFVLCTVLHLGIMFNASTGVFIYGILMLAALVPMSRTKRSLLMLAAYLLVMIVLAVGLFMPDRFEADLNTYLRLNWWRDNLASLWHSGMVGVGFGTPYFPMRTESLEAAQQLADMAPQFEWAFWDPLDSLYVRAQHSSIVNVFYRMGLVGGGLFLALNLWMFGRLLGLVRSAEPFLSRLGLVAFALGVINLFQISMHVGLESPRFFMIYILTMALACLAIELGRSAGQLAGAAPVPRTEPGRVGAPEPSR